MSVFFFLLTPPKNKNKLLHRSLFLNKLLCRSLFCAPILGAVIRPLGLYIYFLHMFTIFSLVCFLICGVKSRSGHDRSQSFSPISHISDPKLDFGCNFIMVLHGFAWRSSKNIVLRPKNFKLTNVFLDTSAQNHAESSGNYLKT